MKFTFHVNISYSLIFIAINTLLIEMTKSNKIVLTRQTNYNSSNEELSALNKQLQVKINELEKLYNSLRFLKRMCQNFISTLNSINDRNKATSIEIHNIPSLNMEEQYFLVQKLSIILFGSFDDNELSGVRVFFTHKNTQNRKLIVQFQSLKIKNKWFRAFTNRCKRMGFSFIKYFPGFNITLYDGTEIKGITVHDHISKFKASVLKVSQGLLSKFRYIKVFINNSQIYVDRKIKADTFIRYLLRDFEDVRDLKTLLLREKVPLMNRNWANDEITPMPTPLDLRYVFTKYIRQYSSTYCFKMFKPPTSPKMIVNHHYSKEEGYNNQHPTCHTPLKDIAHILVLKNDKGLGHTDRETRSFWG